MFATDYQITVKTLSNSIGNIPAGSLVQFPTNLIGQLSEDETSLPAHCCAMDRRISRDSMHSTGVHYNS